MVIESGIEAGETVVTEGQLRLAPGSRVVVRDGRGGGRGRGSAEGGSKEGGGREGGGAEGGGDKGKS
jgi:membrane fusion protein, multidrug efflux system